MLLILGLLRQWTKKREFPQSFVEQMTFERILADLSTTFINLPQNQFDNKSERANSNQDVRRRFIVNFTASTPNHGFARNFDFSSVITVQSGRPFTEFVGGDANGDTNPVTDRVGLSGRNSYVGQPLRSWDLRVSRALQINERLKLSLMFDAFNVLNHVNYGTYIGTVGSPLFGQPVTARPARQLQLSARFKF